MLKHQRGHRTSCSQPRGSDRASQAARQCAVHDAQNLSHRNHHERIESNTRGGLTKQRHLAAQFAQANCSHDSYHTARVENRIQVGHIQDTRRTPDACSRATPALAWKLRAKG